ncbi:MAG: tetratricopeptide repeat protein [Candidatus Hydrogenedentota bacterium]
MTSKTSHLTPETAELKEALRRNWHWAALCAVFLAVGLVPVITGGTDQAGDQGRAARAETGASAERQLEPTPTRATGEERALSLIERHEAALADNPDDLEAPALLSAMGNVYRQRLNDYESAARAYETILLDYPDWPQIRTVFPQLQVCYKQLDDWDGVDWVYQQMMEIFPEDSEEHLYARTQLGR